MVAGVEVTVMFNGECVTAGLIEDAEARIVAQPRLKRDIENLYKNSADVVHYPLIKNRT